jgi:nucleoside-diphosphate-sugar epimerase
MAVGPAGRDSERYVGTGDGEGYPRSNGADGPCGDASKAAQRLGWLPRARFHELIRIMLSHDMRDPERRIHDETLAADPGATLAGLQ